MEELLTGGWTGQERLRKRADPSVLAGPTSFASTCTTVVIVVSRGAVANFASLVMLVMFVWERKMNRAQWKKQANKRKHARQRQVRYEAWVGQQRLKALLSG